jgi:CubicO group peptidase (beta-lactamase class C family)
MASIEGRIDVVPREVGYDEAKLKTLEDHLSRRIDAGKLQGASFLMARRGKVFAHRALGRLTPEAGSPPLRPDSLKGLASLTKPFTATAILKLVEDGVLWLAQPAKTIFPELDNPMHGDITLWNLLTHTSGLAPDGGYLCEPYPFPRYEWWLNEKDWVQKAVAAGPMVCRPGESWNYCSMGYQLLAEAVSRVSGKHFYDYVEQEILAPLGMTRTMFVVPESLRSERSWSAEWQRYDPRRDRVDGGGGLTSTLPDLLRFARCFLGGGELEGRRILGRKTVEEMTRNQLPPGFPAFHWGKRLSHYRHGLGWGLFCDGSTVGPATFSHEGYGWVALFIDPAEQFVFAQFICDAGPWDPALVVVPRTIAFSGIL